MPFTQQKQRLFTFSDYRDLPEGEPAELIEGVFYNMSPAPSTEHQRISIALSSRLFDALSRMAGSRCEVFAAPFDVRLPEADEADDEITTVVQPDLSVICDPEKLNDKGCRGAPDLIVEILSPSSAAMDSIRKRQLYERHQVREYWIISPEYRLVTVYRLEEDGRYGLSAVYDEKSMILSEAVPGLDIHLEDIFWKGG